MSKIPSDEDFEKASLLMKQRSRGLDEVRDMTFARFRTQCPLRNLFVLPQRDVDFRVYVFFERTADVEACHASGLSQRIMEFVNESLTLVGRGNDGKAIVAFEFDSHENVVLAFEGDYTLRLR